MSGLLYNTRSVFGRIYSFYSRFFEKASKPTRHTLTLFAISILVVEGVESVRYVYRRFFSTVAKKSLNTLYYILSRAKVDHSRFSEALASVALSLVPKAFKNHPVFLCVDDTLIAKWGTEFQDVSRLFDHSAHDGKQYLNGHCFVSLMLCVPVWKDDGKFTFLSVPLGYRVWTKDCGGDTPTTKLSIAAEMIRGVAPALEKSGGVIVLCDSWYARSQMFALTKEFGFLDIICNVRIDTVLYDMAPERTGRRGRPRTKGERLSLDDFRLGGSMVGDFYVAHRKVVTNLLKGTVLDAFVTSAKKEGGIRRLFLSTVPAAGIEMFCAWYEKTPINQTGSDSFRYLPLMAYSIRWNIEVGYYEQKTFWSLRKYMVRSRKGIETLLNVINVAYAGMKLLPFADPAFNKYRDASPQELRATLGHQMREQVFISGLELQAQVDIKSMLFEEWLKTNTYDDVSVA